MDDSTGSGTRADDVLGVLRRPRRARLLFRGFGPLVVAALLVIAMMLLLPSVAPERIVQRPVDAGEPAAEGAP
jgi:hypothetical protein